jgi:hypothetical protein
LANLISIENLYLEDKQNKENLVKEIRRFVDSGIVKTCDELDPNERQLSFVIGLMDIELVPWSIVHCFK